MYDFHLLTAGILGVHNNPAKYWNSSSESIHVSDIFELSKAHHHAYATAQRSVRGEAYVDIHNWKWDPKSFLDQMTFLHDVKLLRLQITDMVPTQPNTFEFYVTFKF